MTRSTLPPKYPEIAPQIKPNKKQTTNVNTPNNNDKPYITPRGLFCISGYPKEKRVPKFMNNPIINETKMLLKEVK